jgi:hypothetical protein
MIPHRREATSSIFFFSLSLSVWRGSVNAMVDLCCRQHRGNTKDFAQAVILNGL